MAPSRDKFSRMVRFTQIEVDQTLLQAVERALEEQPARSFSDLCKQALQQFLLAPQVAQVSVVCPVGRLEQQIMQLEGRLERLEHQVDRGGIPSEEVPVALVEDANHHEVDPLLSRLAPLLEDF